MWKCPECETLNDGDRCIICNWESEGAAVSTTTSPLRDTGKGLQRAKRLTSIPSDRTSATSSSASSITYDPKSGNIDTAEPDSAYSGRGAGRVDRVYTATPVHETPPQPASDYEASSYSVPKYEIPPRSVPHYDESAGASSHYTTDRSVVSRKEFFDTYLSEKLRKGFKTNIRLAYACIIISVVANIAIYGLTEGQFGIEYLIGAMIELTLYLGCIVGVHKNKSKGCAIGLVVLTAANSLISMATSGKMTGWLFLAAAISLLKVIIDGNKEYKAYIAGV